MAVAELVQLQREAGAVIGIDPGTMDEIVATQTTRVMDLGTIALVMEDGGRRHIRAWNGHAGPEGLMYKGGTRLSHRRPEQDVREMPMEMVFKPAIDNLRDAYGNPVGGGKTIVDVDPETITYRESVRLFEELARRMDDKGLLDHRKRVPAGDLGSNHPHYMDAYAAMAWELNSDPYWQAVITGKSVEQGGEAFRPDATALGVVLAVEFAREQAGIDGVADVTISGAGNVGGRTGYFLSQNSEELSEYRIVGYSDRFSTLRLTDCSEGAPGIVISQKVVEDILDNPNFAKEERFAAFHGDKMRALKAALLQEQPNLKVTLIQDPNAILSVPSDIFVPASIGGLITAENIDCISAGIIVEAANSPMTQAAHQRALQLDKKIVAGEEANTSGVGCSMLETIGNVDAVRYGTPLPDYETAKQLVSEQARERFARVERMRQLIADKHPLLAIDRRLAAYAVGVANLALQGGAHFDREFQNVISHEHSLAA